MIYGDANSYSGAPARDKIHTRWGQLQSERASWWAHWKEISDYLLPRSGRFFVQDRNKGTKRHNNILDNTGTRALRILGAGLMAGATSPARPWFALGTADPELNRYQPVQLWLQDVTRRMLSVFQRSNSYRTLHGLYEELAAFGTSASIVLPDHANTLHHYPSTIGEFAIATDFQGRVNTLYREFDKTVAELVAEFGYKNCSTSVQSMYTSGNLDQWITIIHAIEPRSDRERDVNKRDGKNKAWKSCYFELGGDGKTFLRESGYDIFPVLAPRWIVSGGDIYGTSPGMESLGDIKQLQHEQLRKAQAIDYQTKPPLQAPTSMKNRDIETLPGGVSFVDASGPGGGIRTAFETNLRLDFLLQDIEDCRDRVRSAFYADLFLMLANDRRSGITATEIAERHEEKLLMLGPVLERLHNELLDPMIDITFQHMLQRGMIPPPPQELQGMELNVEFISMLAQAQRAVGTSSIDRMLGTVGAVAQMKPDVLDKIDADELVDAYSQMLGVDPRLIIPNDQVAVVRQARDRALAAKESAQSMQSTADMAQKLGTTPTGNQPNALNDIVNMFSGYSSPGPTAV